MSQDSPLTRIGLVAENIRYFGTAGRSAGNRDLRFRPAFLDTDTGKVHFSRFADGRPAAVHVLDGLPKEVVVARNVGGRVCAVKGSLVSGFVRDGAFYTRDEALRLSSAESDALLAART